MTATLLAGLMIALAVIWGLEALLWRSRVAALHPLAAPDDATVDPAHAFLVADGVSLDDATRAAASALATERGFGVVELVPGDLPTRSSVTFLRLFDPARLADQPIAPGLSTGYALLVTRDVLTRARLSEDASWDRAGLFREARRLKFFTPHMGFALAPALKALPNDLPGTRAWLADAVGVAAPIGFLLQLGLQALMIAGLVLAPIATAVAIAAFQLQLAVATAGTALRPRDRLLTLLLRWPLLGLDGLRMLTARAPDRRAAAVDALRPAYAEALAEGTGRFFEPRRTTCPLCDADTLRPWLTSPDMVLGKPGTFQLDRCGQCGHTFQNPRLNLDGLSFYYRDFYDGLGGEFIQFVLGANPARHRQQAEAARGLIEPERWLDVGGGYGYFCRLAQTVWPDVRFDGLDLSDGIDEAARRGWVEYGYHGLFPELAADLEACYDVVSMGHYLEHTLQPRDELDAAWRVLKPDGLVIIEVPDPGAPQGRWLGRFWMPWFQPQHLNLMSRANMADLLVKHGFEPLRWHRAEADISSMFTFGLFLLLNQIAPPLDWPWRPPASALFQLWRALVWGAGLPLLILAFITDKLIGPLRGALGMNNTFRVVAQRLAAPASPTQHADTDHPH